MNLRFPHKKWILITTIIIIVVIASSLFLATIKISYDNDSNAVLTYFANQAGMPDAFTALQNLTPSDAVVLCWWDYGRAVQQWSHREVIEAYPSREIAKSVGSTRSFWGNLGGQIFGTWGSNERIHDIALAFMLNEEQSLQILEKYGASYVLVFIPDELEKFYWIANIAGFNSTDYLTQNTKTQAYETTSRAAEVTLLRLIYDSDWQPRHFTKIFTNDRAKIYQINH